MIRLFQGEGHLPKLGAQPPGILQTVVKVAEWAVWHLWRKHTPVFQSQGKVTVPSTILICLLEASLVSGSS